VEKDLLPESGKKSTRIVSKAMPSPNKGSMAILLEASLCVFIQERKFMSMLSLRS
jgi:hypothetical protein